MNTNDSTTPAPWHMWIVGGLFLINNGLGATNYILTVIRYEPHLAQFPPEALAYFTNAPQWMYAMWGVSTIGGLISAVLLLLRRRLALHVGVFAWICSLIAVIYGMVNPAPGASNVLSAAIIFIALLVLVYMYWLLRRGVLR